MAEKIAEVSVFILETYAAIGVVFALAFVSFGARRVDPQTIGSGVAFRLLLLPGVAAFWPLLLRRLIANNGNAPEEVNPHK